MLQFGKDEHQQHPTINMLIVGCLTCLENPMINLSSQVDPLAITRRQFFSKTSRGLGVLGLASLFPKTLFGAASQASIGGLPGFPNFPAKAKRVIYLFQSGAPSQMDLFDYKPLLNKLNGEQLPEHVRAGQRLTGMTSQQASIPLAGSIFPFKQHGQAGTWFSDLLPHTAGVADEICVIRSMFTEAINHHSAITFFQTGSQIAGRPSLGSWVHFRLGAINQSLPAFHVLVTPGQREQPLYVRLLCNR